MLGSGGYFNGAYHMAFPFLSGRRIDGIRTGLQTRSSRIVLALFFTIAGTLHFIYPNAYIGVMPPWLGWHAALVFISGVAEVAGGVGVLQALTRRWAGWGLLALCVAVLPANLQMLIDALAAARPAWIIALLVVRLPLQLLLMWWIWLATHATTADLTRP